MATQVSVKYKAPQTLHRTPVLITTNKNLWHYCEADEAAIKNRIFHFEFNRAACEYPEWIKYNYADCRRGYKQFVTALCHSISELESRPRSRSELDESACSSDCSADSEYFRTNHEYTSPDVDFGRYHDQQLFHTTSYELLRWWYDNGRSGSRRRESLECTERQRSSSSDSTTTDDERKRPNEPTRNTIRKRRYTYDRCSTSGESRPVLRKCHRADGRRPDTNRRGNLRRNNRGVFPDYKNCPEFVTQFYIGQFGSGALKKIPQSKTLAEEPKLGWLLDSASKIERLDWLNLIKLFWLFHNACGRISNC